MKAIAILLLTVVIFGGAAYFTYDLFFKRQQQMQEEKGQLPPAPPPDPTLPDFQKCVTLQDSAPMLQVRTAWQDFVERFPQSSRIGEAKERLGLLNSSLYLSPIETPDKTVYTVLPGDVITRVATRTGSTPELIMQVNNLHITTKASGQRLLILRIGQRLIVPPSDFSVLIERKSQQVVLLQKGRFFRQYPILTMPERKKVAGEKKAAATPRPPKVEGKVADRIAWHNQQRVIYTDKEFPEAEHWVVISPPGYSLYAEVPVTPGAPPPRTPSGGGFGLSPEAAREIAVLLRKNDSVIID